MGKTLKSINHLAIKVKELAICENFYTDVLGFLVMKRNEDVDGNPRSVWLRCGDAILMLEKCSSLTSEHPPHGAMEGAGWHLVAFDIGIEDREMWKKRLGRAGIEIESESRYSIYFKDPEGNRLALSHYPDAVEPIADLPRM